MACIICSAEKEGTGYPVIYEASYWRIKLPPNQTLLGRCVVTAKRHVGDIADLTKEEVDEFFEVVRKLENALRKAFNPQVFNWSCLMNHSFRKKPYVPHVHWWMVPRYDHDVEFEGQIYTDPHFGNPFDHNRYEEAPIELQNKLIKRIKTKF